MSIADNLKTVTDRIASAAQRAGRDPSSVKLVVVTKTVDPVRIREAVAAGAKILGENRVQEALEELMRGRTSIIIAHRLATILACDRIVVMDHGRIHAIGTHRQLLEQSSLYARLAALQFGEEALIAKSV